MNKKLVLGTFNSEQFWKDESYAGLPGITDLEADNIVSVMDELLFIFCESDENIVITRYKAEDSFHKYLSDIGFKYKHASLCDHPSNLHEFDNKRCIFDLMQDQDRISSFGDTIGLKLSTYSITPFTKSFCDKYSLFEDIPDIKIIREVNSKKYSHQLSHKLEIDIGSVQINNSVELESKGNILLKKGPIIIKEYMGVSGKGNHLIDSELMLNRLVKYFTKQEIKNKSIGLILEPYIRNKKLDFSCQLNISPQGKVTILSFQQMINEGFSFRGIKEADASLVRLIRESKYCEIVETIGSELYNEGYHGPVCIDSMLLTDNNIIPIIEINARKSMGLINYHIDKLLQKYSVKGRLMFYTFSSTNNITFKEFSEKLKQAKILFTKESPFGILPLTCTSLNLNYHLGLINNNKYKGRLYFSVVSKTNEDEEHYIQKLLQIAIEMDLSIMN